MRFFVLLLSLYSAACFSNAEKVQGLGQNRLGMFDGTVSTIEKHPYMVQLYGDKEYFWCAGTIVSDSWVVTSAACPDSGEDAASNLLVVAGTNSTIDGGTAYTVSQVVRHPQYDAETFDYSYALIQIDGSFTWSDTVQKVNLPTTDFSTGVYYDVAGWGYTDTNDEGDFVLREGTMKPLSKLSCSILYALQGLKLTDRQGCALNKKKTTLCTGDIGDPFVLNGMYYGHFIYPSYLGDMCSANARAVLLSKIYPVVDWIKETIGSS